MPRLVLVHDKIGGSTGMGWVAAFAAQTASDAGWRVRLVASEFAPAFRERCEVTRVLRPARPPQVRQDLVWFADVMTCHHLAFSAHQHGVRASGTGIGAWARRAHLGTLIGFDEIFYRSRPARTRITFVSEFLREQFRDRYGEPTDGSITAPPSPPWRPVADDERVVARARYGVRGTGLVVGYVGGDDQRKGVHIVRQLAGGEGIELLLGGPDADRLSWPATTNVGFVDVDAFLPACDVVVAPALFDAAPTAVTQALARGVPIVVGRASGWAAPIARAGAGVVWDGRAPLLDAVREAARAPQDACRSVTDTYSASRQGARLLDVYERVLAVRRERPARCARVENGTGPRQEHVP